MAKHGFLDVLEAALDKHFTYDYELNWDKKTTQLSWLSS